MRRLALAAALLVGAAIPASAQYYGGGGYEYGPPRGDYGYRRPPPDYDYEPRRERYYGGPPPGYGRRGSSVCITSRGNCPIGGVVPRNSPCGCDVPGFGYKRGAAG